MKTMIYPIYNWNKYNYFINGSNSISYKNNKYQIGIGYDNNTIRFALLSPDKLDSFNATKSDKTFLFLDLNNYWDGCVALAEFNIINIYNEDNETYRDFFTTDIKCIRDCYISKFKRKFTNENIYILKDNYYCADYEFNNDKDKILGIFIKKICKNFTYYLRLLHSIYNDNNLVASIYDNKSHKYLTDAFIVLRHGYEKDIDTITDEEYIETVTTLEKKFSDMGFVSINDYTGFEGSHGFVFLNPTSNKELIYFYKFLYNDIRDKHSNFKA